MTKMEVMEMLDEMEEETTRSVGFIAGFVTETFVIHMIRRKKAQVGAKEEGWANDGPAAYRREDGIGKGDGAHWPAKGDREHGTRDGSQGKEAACPIEDPEGYDDLFLYVPEARQAIRIAEGSGDNLHQEDIEDGYVDYIYYEQHGIGAGMPIVDGGQVLLEERLRDRYECLAGCIPDVLDMAYGNSRLGYMIL